MYILCVPRGLMRAHIRPTWMQGEKYERYASRRVGSRLWSGFAAKKHVKPREPENRLVFKGSIWKNVPRPWEIWTFKWHFEVNVGNGSGI